MSFPLATVPISLLRSMPDETGHYLRIVNNHERRICECLGRKRNFQLSLFEKIVCAAALRACVPVPEWEQRSKKVVPAGPCDQPGASPACGGGDRGGL